MRAQIDPLRGLNFSCAALVPTNAIQSLALSGSGAFFGSAKESESASKMPALPGVGAREAFRGRPQEAPQQLGPRAVDRRPGGGSAARVPGGPQGVLVAPQAPQAPQAPRQPAALEGLERGRDARISSDRGRASRTPAATIPAPSAPVSRPRPGAATPAPSAPKPPGGQTGAGGGERK